MFPILAFALPKLQDNWSAMTLFQQVVDNKNWTLNKNKEQVIG